MQKERGGALLELYVKIKGLCEGTCESQSKEHGNEGDGDRYRDDNVSTHANGLVMHSERDIEAMKTLQLKTKETVGLNGLKCQKAQQCRNLCPGKKCERLVTELQFF